MSTAGPPQGANCSPSGGSAAAGAASVGAPMSARQFWIGVVSLDHVAIATAGGFAQLNHGKAGPLERMHAGDGLAFYSPRATYPYGEPLQAFTAIGRVRTGTVYQSAAGGLRPFRLDVDYLPGQPASIKPLIDRLSFIRSKTHWGAAFRFGVVRVPPEDFALIAQAMGRSFAEDFAPVAA